MCSPSLPHNPSHSIEVGSLPYRTGLVVGVCPAVAACIARKATAGPQQETSQRLALYKPPAVLGSSKAAAGCPAALLRVSAPPERQLPADALIVCRGVADHLDGCGPAAPQRSIDPAVGAGPNEGVEDDVFVHLQLPAAAWVSTGTRPVRQGGMDSMHTHQERRPPETLCACTACRGISPKARHRVCVTQSGMMQAPSHTYGVSYHLAWLLVPAGLVPGEVNSRLLGSAHTQARRHDTMSGGVS